MPRIKYRKVKRRIPKHLRSTNPLDKAFRNRKTRLGEAERVSDAYINKHFIVRYFPDSKNTTENVLTTAAKLRELVGDTWAEELNSAAAKTKVEIYERKLRRGCRVVYKLRGCPRGKSLNPPKKRGKHAIKAK
jgi:hypothetical protein